MKSILPLTMGTAAMVLLAVRLPAQEPNFNDQLLRVHQMAPLGNLEKANKISGMEVTGVEGNKIGKVKDLAIDLENGRVVEVLVSAGGFMGIDSKLVAIPPQEFSWDGAKALHLNLTQEQLKDAPTFDIDAWRQDFENARIAERYARYELKPYFLYDTNFPVAASPRQAENAEPARRPKQPLGYVDKASKVVGMTVKNLTGEKLGKVENLMIDLPSGRIVTVVVASGGFLGMDNELSAVPPASLFYNRDNDGLEFNITKEALLRAPHFNSRDWAPVNQPQYVAEVYRSYQVEPYFIVNTVDNTERNVRDRHGENLTPLDQGSSKEDLQITQQIRKQIMAQKSLSLNAHNVKVITVNGQVTLRGPVNTEDEKRIINDIALNVVGRNATVHNRLEVKNPSEVSDVK